MRLITFLAGVAAGVLLNQSRTARNASTPRPYGAGGGMQADTFGTTAGRGPAAGRTMGTERDYPTHSPPRTDAELRERIRSQVARTIRNPEAIQVDVSGGCVTLRGQVRAQDSVLLMAEVENAAGVQSVRNELDIQGSLDEIAPNARAMRAAEGTTSDLP